MQKIKSNSGKLKGLSSIMAVVLAVVFVVIGGIAVVTLTGYKLQSVAGGGPINQPQGGAGSCPAGGATLTCPNAGTTTLNLNAKNPLNATTYWNAPTVLAYTSNGYNLLGSFGALTAGNGNSQTAITITLSCPSNNVGLFIFGTQSYAPLANANTWLDQNSCKSSVVSGTNIYPTLQEPSTSGLIFSLTNAQNAYQNGTNFASGTTNYQFSNGTSLTQTIGSSALTVNMLVQVNTSYTQFGAGQFFTDPTTGQQVNVAGLLDPQTNIVVPNLMCFRYDVSTMSVAGGLNVGTITTSGGSASPVTATALSGFSAVPWSSLPTSIASIAGNGKCYQLSRPLLASDGVITIPLSLKGDLGSVPSSTAVYGDITAFFISPALYVDSLGHIRAGYSNPSGTAIGQQIDRFAIET